MKLEDKIIKLRIKNNLSKKIIAEYLGISEDEYYKIEHRKLAPYGFEILKKIALLYNYELFDFFKSDEIKVTSLFRFNGLTATDLSSIAYFHEIIIQYKKISNLIEECPTI